MSLASVIVAAALAAWGPVAPEPSGSEATEVADPDVTTAPAAGEGEPIPPPPVPPSGAAPPAAAPAGTAVPRPSIVAKAPLDVRARPAIGAWPRPASQPSKPLQRQWAFWVIAGGLFASTIVITYAVTRPKPDPYTGNGPPYFISFP